MKTIDKLKAMNPCRDGLAHAVECGTLREWWDLTLVRSDMTWLLGEAHVVGTLSRRRLVSVSLSCAETVAHLMPEEALPHVADLRAWAEGADDVDLVATRDALRMILRAADAAYAAAYAADAAYAAAYAAYAAYAAADAASAAYAAYAAYAADAAATCDVIRDAISIDDVCAALGLGPDEALS